MHRMRFRTPAGAVRVGEYDPDAEVVAAAGRAFDRASVDVLPPCDPSKVVCVGRNYAAHADERDADVPDRPLLFLKPPTAVAGHGDATPLPPNTRVEHEAELAVVIGTQARNLDAGAAMAAVEGYTVANDVSNRTDQDREQNWVRGKAFDGSCPLGPVVATPDEVPDDATVALDVNGERRQSGSISQFVFDVPTLLAEITAFVTLQPGDVVLTGTPPGVGELTDGDRVAASVEGVGTLEHTVVREPPA
ncbi:fumarylacetoacetate hydrolase family protein [Halobacterium salinarum]|uniref:Fumarylacetoacetase family protein n=4 Tax=Halobacterium salinarum TaxID=2242 RepID=A0A510N607_HALSA|nr:fumarylacetoacetate hydrolase family protein [Halobacterium salinarum]MBB6090131.1 2-keto-4-pentenoate hydratase/2-oxohepta-3-ene-1,7-dioic acid hydratase in catechol pathway [Halobacterium salinarum]MDL0131567.1 fumarylacetoacetate hydrolase family protein [Halobacterium salinarum]MDL0138320.1 fumarylacetoacetate hydrolase family protein [Halobacterium salinarum]UEB92871.1 fumarylacetoacetate hydrolase family protein [Halobacterium salinarum NRC-34001]CAP13723.1 fumarylacetoacetase family 